LFFLCLIIVWPHYYINLDFKSFHYHKLWQGPDLSNLTFGKFDKKLDILLGADFHDKTEYKYKINLQEETLANQKADEIVKLLRNRLSGIGYNESSLYWVYENGEYFLKLYIEESDVLFSKYKSGILGNGKLVIWGEKDTTQENATIEVEGENVDPLQSYLQQNFDKLELDANKIKGFKVGKEDENYYFKIILEDSESETITQAIYSYWDKSLISSLDGQIFMIDGKDLGEQIQYYKEIKSVKFIGLTDEDLAKLYGSVIKNGPLGVYMEEVETISTKSNFTKQDLKKVILINLSILTILSIICFLKFKFDGLVRILSMILYCLLLLLLLKLLSIKITLAVVISFLLCLIMLLIIFTFDLIVNHNEKNKGNLTELNYSITLKNKEFIDLLNEFIIMISVIFLIFGTWQFRNLSLFIFTNIIIINLLYSLFIPFVYQFIFNIKDEYKNIQKKKYL